MISAYELTAMIDFIYKYHNRNRWKEEPRHRLFIDLLWHDMRGLLAVSGAEDDIQALCTIRLFSDLRDWLVPFVFDQEGQFLMVELLIARSAAAAMDCYNQLLERWGPRPVVLWERGERTENGKAPRMFRWDQFMKIVRRIQ